MSEPIPNLFNAAAAYDQSTGQTVKNGSAQVYAASDTSFTTPLSLLEHPSGVSMGTTLTSSNDGVFPPFIVDSETEYTQVNVKSGDVVTLVEAYYGRKGDQGPEGPPGPGVPPIEDGATGQVVTHTGDGTAWAYPPAGGGSGISGAPAVWPSTFPAEPHSHTAAQVSDSSSVGRQVLTAENAQAARDAIGAGTGNGTSNLTLGSSGTQAAPGNHTHGASALSFTPTGSVTATNVQDAIVQAAATGTGSGTSSVLVVKYASGAYPALPASKPAGVDLIIFKGPVQPTSGNVAGGIPSYVGDGPTQIMADYEYRNLT